MTKKNGPRKGTCPVCGRVFEKTPGNRVCCSKECSGVWHRRKVAEAYRKKQRHAERGLKPITHICTVCGKKYTNYRKKSVRCPKCLGIQKCIICGKEGVASALLVCRECLQRVTTVIMPCRMAEMTTGACTTGSCAASPRAARPGLICCL